MDVFVVSRVRRLQHLLLGVSIVATGVLTACSGNGVVLSKQPAQPTVSSAYLPAAQATGCINADAAGQTVALPAAGGLGGSVSVGPVTATSSVTCAVTVDVATGADATLGLTQAAAHLRRDATTPGTMPSPLAQIELTTANTTTTLLSITVTVPSSVPAGSYPVVVSSQQVGADGELSTVTTNYSLTVNANGTATLSAFTFSIGQYASTIVTIYPPGTVLPTPAPTPSISPTPGPTMTPSASAAPTESPSPTPYPTAPPTPTPTASSAVPAGTVVATSLGLSPAGCYQFGTSSTTQTFTVDAQTNAPSGTTIYYSWFNNISPFTLTVPGAVSSVDDYYLPSNQTASEQNTANVTSPNFPCCGGSEVGAGAQLTVTLYSANGEIGNYQPVDFEDGSRATATSTVYGGADICPAMTTSSARGPRIVPRDSH